MRGLHDIKIRPPSDNGMSGGKGLTNGCVRENVRNTALSHSGLTNGNGCTNGLGRTNGLTNGVGRTNGMTNGVGRTNGLTNGIGKTNGLGRINGLGSGRFNDQGAVQPKRLSVIIVVVLLIMLPVSLILLGESQTVPGQLINVNGKFGDWDKMTKYVDTSMCADAPLDITEFAMAFDETDFCAYVQTQGNMLSRATVDRYFAFIDADGSASTGYATVGLGAEYVVEAYGYNTGSWQVSSSKFYGSDQTNWSAFSNIGSGHAVSKDEEMELKASLDQELNIGGALRVRFATMTGSAMADICAPIVDGANGALVITQTPQDVSGIVSTNSLLSLQLRAVGKDVAVSSLTIAAQGVGATSQGGFAAGTVAVNTAMTVQVTGDVPALANGTLVKASVSSAAVTMATYNVNGNGLAAYANVAPATIAIDGAFADWNGITKSSDAANDVTNPNIDIIENAVASQSNSFFAYVKFNGAGKAMAGMAVPSTRVVPSGINPSNGTSPGPTVLPRVSGEDLTRIYIDSVASGSAIGGISADYMIELKGKNGQVTSKNVYTYPAKLLVAGVVAAVAGTGAIETNVAYSLIGNPTGTIRMFVETTDWDKNTDTSDSIYAVNTSISSTRATHQEKPTGGSGPNYPPPGTGDWLITGDTSVWSETITVNGNLIITDTGCLTLNNCNLKMNCAADGQYKIRVNVTGTFYVYDSTITASNTAFKYRFEVYGRLWTNHSTVEYMWGATNTAPYPGGIQIYGAAAKVWLNHTKVWKSGANGIHAIGVVGLNITGNSNITGNTRHEFYAENGNYLNLTNSNFTDYVDAQLGGGIWIKNAINIVIDNCRISHHLSIGLYLVNVSNAVVQYCDVGVGASTTQNVVDGIDLDNCFLTVRIFNNTIINNGGHGILLAKKSSPIIENNNISQNAGSGISNGDPTSFYSTFYIYNNTIGNNTGAGIYMVKSNATIFNNRLWANNIRMYSSYARIEGCYIRGSSAISLNASSPLVINTTIELGIGNPAFYLVNNSHPFALNCTVDHWERQRVMDTSNLTVQNYLHVRVLDWDGITPIPNAWVNVTDNGLLKYSGQTNAIGECRWIIVTNRTYLQDYWTIVHPFKNIAYNKTVVSAEKGIIVFNNNPRTSPMVVSHWEIFQVPEFELMLIPVISMLFISIMARRKKMTKSQFKTDMLK
jgi:parallel beta-helix repeat protein